MKDQTVPIAVANVNGKGWVEVDPLDQEDYKEFICLSKHGLLVKDDDDNVVTLDPESAKEIYKMVAKFF